MKQLWLTRRIVQATVLSLLALACGGGTTSPTAPLPSPSPGPSPAPTPQPGPMVVKITGTWAGTMEASNAPGRPITMSLVDAAGCVDGTWQSTTTDWRGVVSGNNLGTTFEGLFSIAYTDTRGKVCSGTAIFKGPVENNALRWTSSRFTGECNELPENVTVTFERR